MLNIKPLYLSIAIVILVVSLLPKEIQNLNLEKGLDWKKINYIKKDFQLNNIHILKINPKYFSLHLFSSKQVNHKPLPLSEWSKKYGLIAAINASMYLPDQFTSTGYMRNSRYINNGVINKRFGAFISFNPKNKNMQRIAILEMNNSNWKNKIKNYNTVIQNYRIINRNQKIVWAKNNKKSSIASFGIDTSGNILFIICQDKTSTYKFAEILQKLDLNIYNMAYLEGGHEAALFINHKNTKRLISGKLFNSQRGNLFFSQTKLPNIIGIRKR